MDSFHDLARYDYDTAAELADMARKRERENQRHDDYREQVRRTFRAMSDRALAFQNARVIGGIDREELDRELGRRRERENRPDYGHLAREDDVLGTIRDRIAAGGNVSVTVFLRAGEAIPDGCEVRVLRPEDIRPFKWGKRRVAFPETGAIVDLDYVRSLRDGEDS